MRARDRIYYGVLIGLSALHFCALGGAVAFHWWNVNRLLPRLSALEDGLRAEETARADGIAAARADLRASSSSVSPSPDVESLPSPQLLGFGQTKSQKRRYIYADYRLPDGTVHRQYVQDFPLQN